MDGIEIKGIELLNEEQKHELNKELEKYSEKIRWKTKSDFVIKLVIKQYAHKAEDKDNKQKKYSVQAQIKGETHSFDASADDWDFHKVVHKIFDKLLTEIEHFYHSSEQKTTNKRISKE